VDVTETFDLKIKALSLHKSQVSDVEGIRKRMMERAEALGKLAGCKYAEGFVRLRLPE
jgi:hypothetical protein